MKLHVTFKTGLESKAKEVIAKIAALNVSMHDEVTALETHAICLTDIEGVKAVMGFDEAKMAEITPNLLKKNGGERKLADVFFEVEPGVWAMVQTGHDEAGFKANPFIVFCS